LLGLTLLAVFEELGVDELELSPLFREIVLKEDRFYRTNFGTDTAIDTLIRVDEVLVGIIGRMDTVDRTNLDTAIVLDADTGLGDHVRHGTSLLTRQERAVRVGALGPAADRTCARR
jgi:hypothetical protein